MQAGKQRLFVTQTYKTLMQPRASARYRLVCRPGGAIVLPGSARAWASTGQRQYMLLAFLAAFMLALMTNTTIVQAQKFRSTTAAFEQGIQAYRAGYYHIAIPALQFAADQGSFVAQFYLARIYSNPSRPYVDHGKAYRLYYQIARDNLDIDPVSDFRAVIVAKSLTAVAGYVLRGVSSIGLRADRARAIEFLRQSALQFGDLDAQFELAKLYLGDDNKERDRKLARHFLSVLTQKGHAGAQAYLADLLWRGKYVKKNRSKAMALITMAMANAPNHERPWIGDIYQNIFCGASKSTRQKATEIMSIWTRQYGHIAPGQAFPDI